LKSLAKVMAIHGLVELAESQTTKMDHLLQAEGSPVILGQKAIKVFQEHKQRTIQDQPQAESGL
jgi:hypothetical protein